MNAIHWPLISPARRIIQVCRDEGVVGLIARVVARTVRPLVWVERVGFYDSDLSTLGADAPPVPGLPVEVRPATRAELLGRHRDALEFEFGVAPADIEQRLARSHVAMIALHQGQLVAMVWLAFNAQQVSEVGRVMRLRAGEFLTYNEATLPEWRGRGISPHLNQCAGDYARRHGATRRITWRRLGNTAAVRVATKLHDRLFAVVTTVRLFGKDRALVFGLGSTELPLLLPADRG